MNKKAIICLLTVCFIFSAAGSSFAEGNQRKGKYLYRNVFKTCHELGLVDSPKPSINPDAKTKAQWKRVFDNKDFAEFGCADQWGKLTEEELLDIYTYLSESAADSEAPAKCQ